MYKNTNDNNDNILYIYTIVFFAITKFKRQNLNVPAKNFMGKNVNSDKSK